MNPRSLRHTASLVCLSAFLLAGLAACDRQQRDESLSVPAPVPMSPPQDSPMPTPSPNLSPNSSSSGTSSTDPSAPAPMQGYGSSADPMRSASSPDAPASVPSR